MANELIHSSAGTVLTQAEFEAIGLHVCNSQATGDLIYASSSSQLSRLGIGSTNKVLTVIGGVPTWQSTLAGLTLTSPTINGTIGTTGLTLPSVTLGGAVAGGGQNISWLGTIGCGTITLVTGGTLLTGTNEQYQIGDASHFCTEVFTRAIQGFTSSVNFNAQAIYNITAVTAADLYLSTFTQYTETTAPGAGAANTARIYAIVDVGALTDLAAVFQDGTVDIFAQETTPLDSPIFTQPDGTEVKIVQLKPHPGLIQFALKYTNGKTHILREIQYHNEDKIKANTGAKGKLPKDWEVETTIEMEARLAKFEQDRLDAIEAAKNVVLTQAEAAK